jgi:hypothetical protein
VRWVTYRSLVKVPYFNIEFAVSIGGWTKISDVTVATNPYLRPGRKSAVVLA